MSLLKRIFGGRSFDDLWAEADSLLEAGRFGQAKLTYEKALDRAKDAPEDVVAAVREQIAACCDGIARERIRLGREYLEAHEPDLAREELEGAADTAVSEEVAGEARRLLDGMEARDAVTRAEEVEVGDEEKLAAMAGSWEDAQDEEYGAYGEELDRALLDMYDERYAEAREKLEALVAEADGPRYLWLEVGRARLLSGDLAAGEEALRTFLDALEPDEGGGARLSARRELAGLADERGDEAGAIRELSAAVEELEDDPRPLIALGHYLRTHGHAAEAVEVLESAIDVMGESSPEWRVLQELGLACADAGEDERAIDLLESVLKILTARRHYDFPPDTVVPLARLHEKHGQTERAADLFRSLTRGSDRKNHLAYHREAARLLAGLGLGDEARRMLQRALALAAGDDEATAAVDAQLAALDGDGDGDGEPASDGEE